MLAETFKLFFETDDISTANTTFRHRIPFIRYSVNKSVIYNIHSESHFDHVLYRLQIHDEKISL